MRVRRIGWEVDDANSKEVVSDWKENEPFRREDMKNRRNEEALFPKRCTSRGYALRYSFSHGEDYPIRPSWIGRLYMILSHIHFYRPWTHFTYPPHPTPKCISFLPNDCPRFIFHHCMLSVISSGNHFTQPKSGIMTRKGCTPIKHSFLASYPSNSSHHKHTDGSLQD